MSILHGDTDQGAWGWNTYGSRSLAVGGEALARAARKVQDKAKRICAAMLEASPDDIELTDGKYQVKGSPDKSMTMAEISGAAHIPPQELPTDIEPGLEESSFYDPENFVFPFGAHACVVEVDAETGKVTVVRYAAVDDCGPAINPMLIDGQIHGGIVHAIGQALYEQVVYDEDGQLVTGTFVDYALPTAAEVPVIRDRPHRDPVAGQLARREGDRRGRHDRGDAGRGGGGAGRARAARRERARHADDADARLAGDRGGQGPRRRPARHRAGQAARRARAGSVGQRARRPGRGGWRMIPAAFDYEAPESLEEAIRMLHENGEDAKLLAGGHSLLPLMKLRLAAPTVLIDLKKIPGLHGIQRDNGSWRIGPMTRHADLQDTPELGLASRAASLIADQQVRNRGTIGGSLAHGDPASDLPAVLLACDGEVAVRGPGGDREIAAADLFEDYLTTTLAPGRGDHEHPPARARRLRRRLPEVHPARRGLGDGRRGCASSRRRTDGSCADVRIGLTHMGTTPVRATSAEDALRGGALDAGSIAAAAEHAAEGTEPPGDLNATPDYKRHLARVLTRRALEEAAGL